MTIELVKHGSMQHMQGIPPTYPKKNLPGSLALEVYNRFWRLSAIWNKMISKYYEFDSF